MYFRFTAAALMAAVTVSAAIAEPETYELDPDHSQIVFAYEHLGFSTSHGMFNGIEGTIRYDEAAPEMSSVEVSFPVASVVTVSPELSEHLMSGDFFGASGDDTVDFRSTGIEVTGAGTAKIVGDLTLNGVTKEVVLDARLNRAGEHPMENKPWLGLAATASVMRSDFNLGKFAPAVSDEVRIDIAVEAMKAGG